MARLPSTSHDGPERLSHPGKPMTRPFAVSSRQWKRAPILLASRPCLTDVEGRKFVAML
jgi:hypothetical protein